MIISYMYTQKLYQWNLIYTTKNSSINNNVHCTQCLYSFQLNDFSRLVTNDETIIVKYLARLINEKVDYELTEKFSKGVQCNE